MNVAKSPTKKKCYTNLHTCSFFSLTHMRDKYLPRTFPVLGIQQWTGDSPHPHGTSSLVRQQLQTDKHINTWYVGWWDSPLPILWGTALSFSCWPVGALNLLCILIFWRVCCNYFLQPVTYLLSLLSVFQNVLINDGEPQKFYFRFFFQENVGFQVGRK